MIIARRLSIWFAILALIIIAAGVALVGNATAQNNVDYDIDNDGLIDVGSLAQLNALRWDSDGDGAADNADDSNNYSAAFPNAATGMGCPSQGCEGYELTDDLDFDTDGDGVIDSDDAYWNGGKGWEPISDFNAIFDGNRHVISNLYINVAPAAEIAYFGLFSETGTDSELRSIGLEGADITIQGRRNAYTGALVGKSYGTVKFCYSTGRVASNTVSTQRYTGGLIGWQYDKSIEGSYSTADVSGGTGVGGLAGLATAGARVSQSYATGTVTQSGPTYATFAGGLLGSALSTTVEFAYATGSVQGPDSMTQDTNQIGISALVGAGARASLREGYATGMPTGNAPRTTTAGLMAYDYNYSSVDSDAYWDTDTTGQTTSLKGGTGKTTAQLQADTNAIVGAEDYAGIYKDWDKSKWDFGSSSHYPVLKVDFNGDGVATEQEFGIQGRVIYDTDADGLIDVANLAQLNAMRWDADGDGAADNADDNNSYFAAFPNAVSGMGCPSQGCDGYELTGDLDFDTDGDGVIDSDDAYWNGGKGWEPISDYNATFDGNRYVITNLYIDVASTATTGYYGLFAQIGTASELRSVGLKGVDVTIKGVRSTYTGALVGKSYGTVKFCYSTGKVASSTATSAQRYTGGLIGWQYDRSIEGSYSTADVSGGTGVGGLAGLATAGARVSQSYATGTVTQIDPTYSTFAGGLLGSALSTTVEFAYATGSVRGPDSMTQDTNQIGISALVGAGSRASLREGYATGMPTGNAPRTTTAGLMAYDYNYSSVDSDAYWDTDTTGQATSLKGGTGKTTAELQADTNAIVNAEGYDGIYKDWDKSKWDFGSSSQYPVLKVDFNGDGVATAREFGEQLYTDYDTDDDGLITVSSLAQLNAVRWDPDGDGAASDADAAKYKAAFPRSGPDMGCPSAGCSGYELTGDLDFDTDGDGAIDSDDAYWNGGAGWDPITYLAADFDGNDHTISNLFINRPSDGSVGLVSYLGYSGYGVRAVIRNVHLEGVDVTGGSQAGSLVGYNSGIIEGSSVTGKVDGGSIAGGMVGTNTGVITGSSTNVALTANHNAAGGIAGENQGNGKIIASYATGSVTSVHSAGGLVGYNFGGSDSIKESYAQNDVTGGSYSGGLVGFNFGSIVNSYAAGTVTVDHPNDAGGLAGYNGSTCTDSYWDTATSGLTASDCGNGKTTTELQNPTSLSGIFANWDDVWDFGGATDYPTLPTN